MSFSYQLSSLMQAGIVASLDELVKEFVKASGEEKKAIVSKIEEEVGKLEGSSARSTQSLPILIRFFFAHYFNEYEPRAISQ